MYILWPSYVHLMIILCTSYVHLMYILCTSYVQLMIIIWIIVSFSYLIYDYQPILIHDEIYDRLFLATFNNHNIQPFSWQKSTLAYQKHSLNNTRESFVSLVQLHFFEVKTLDLYRTKGVFTLKIQNRSQCDFHIFFESQFSSLSDRKCKHPSINCREIL